MQDETQLLREENAALREENATLRALVSDLLPLKTQVEQLSNQVQQLQNRETKDSHNSHLPPSSDRFARHKHPKSLRKASGKKPGGQPGHPGTTLFQVSDPDQVIIHAVATCSCCQRDLRSVPSVRVERRQVVDVPPKRIVVIEHHAQQKVCPQCQSVTKALFPHDVSAPMQYSPAFAAIGVYLTQQQLLPYARACETIHDLLGPSMTAGTLTALVERCGEHLKPIEKQIKAHLQQATVLHADETGLYVTGKRLWMHVAATAQVTHYAIHAKRGSDATDAIGILPAFMGTCVHDGWSSYWKYPCRHGLCNVHHLRELVYLHEQEQQEWAGDMKTLMGAMHEAVQQARVRGETCLSPLEIADWKAQYQVLLQQGWQANPSAAPPADGQLKRGRRKQSAAYNLLTRLSRHQEAVLLFLENFTVPFDNSQAERDIRMVKVQQKVSGGFRSLMGAEAFCRIRSYLSTVCKQGGALMTALEQALAGHPVSPAF